MSDLPDGWRATKRGEKMPEALVLYLKERARAAWTDFSVGFSMLGYNWYGWIHTDGHMIIAYRFPSTGSGGEHFPLMLVAYTCSEAGTYERFEGGRSCFRDNRGGNFRDVTIQSVTLMRKITE